MTDFARDPDGGSDSGVLGAIRTVEAPRIFSGYARLAPFNILSLALLAVLIFLVLHTFRDYAVTNDEWIQHRYGELIVDYFRSGFTDRAVFALANLYLYGGLFDVMAVLLGHVVSLDVFELRHLMCGMIGVTGLAAAIATARMIGGPRAGLITGVALAVCGSWYGTMFHHTKDIPFAAAMAGATYFLVRATRELPRPELGTICGFGLLTGAALGIRVLGLLLPVYLVVAILVSAPKSARCGAGSFFIESCISLFPSVVIAYVVMVAAWPWSALAPLNPLRALFSFSDFHYGIRTLLDGSVYRMATVPLYYVPAYLVVRTPLLMLAGAALAIWFASARGILPARQRRETSLIAIIVAFPLLCEAVTHGPAYDGLRHFLFILPPLAVLAGIGFDVALSELSALKNQLGAMLLAAVAAGFAWNAVTLYRLHPYEYLAYNSLVGGVAGASRTYVTDYWVTMLPEAVDALEAYLARTEPAESREPGHVYTVAFCGERAALLRKARPHLHWAEVWETADFFIAPTHMNCDYDSRGKIVATVQRLGVPIGYVKDQRLNHD